MADIRVFALSSEEKAAEDIYSIAELAEDADGVLVIGSPGSAEFWENFYVELERVGARWPRIRFIDEKRDTSLSSLSLEDIIELWGEYLEEASKYVLHVTVDVGRELSRRDLVKRGLSLALRYTPLVDVDTKTCGYLRHCSLCLPACPYSALKGKPPEAIREKCVGCGACTSSCPSGLLYQPAVPPTAVRLLIEKAAEKGLRKIIAACSRSRGAAYEKSGDRALIFEVPCIASFRLHEYLYAKLKGVSIEFLCAREDCDKRLAARQHLELISEAEEVLGGPLRALEATRHTLPLLASSFELKVAETKLRLLPLFSIRVDSEKCSLCGACASACPTKAVKYLEDAESVSLLFTSSLCLGCSTCARVCPEAAITLEKKAAAETLAGRYSTLVRSDVARCRVCGAPIGPLTKIKALEKRLREKRAPERAVDGLYLCSKCKADSLVREITQQITKKEIL
ncbi:MAG: 4Fe-4S binding protein [Thermofilum sp.]